MPLDQPLDEDKEMSFLDHVEELRWHLVRSVVAILVLGIAAFIFPEFIFDTLILGPTTTDFWTYRQLCNLSYAIYGDDSLCLKGISFSIKNITMTGQFSQHLFVSFMSGLVVAFPYILWEFWRFIKPALNAGEIKHAKGLVFYGSVLFSAGILFGYYILTPVSVTFMGGYTVSDLISNEITLESYIGFVTVLTFATGVTFELPIVIYFLSKIGLISASFLKRYRRHAFLVILIVAAVVTPPDVVSQTLLTIPIYALFELGILIAAREEKNKS